ncbi:ABC transporter substrate-binding protein [Streptococcus cameli]
MKKIQFLGSVLLLSCLVACAKQTGPAKSVQENNIQVAISTQGNADKLDATSYDAAMSLYSAIYEPLVKYGEKGAFKPGLADSWEILENGKKYVFHLKENVKFSDGTDFTAEDVKFTLERAKFQNSSTTLQTLSYLDKIEILDDYTIELYFSQTVNQVLNELCQTRPLRMMSTTAVEKEKIDGTFQQAIGTGPFTIETTDAESTKMVPNPYYNEEEPVDYSITFKTITDASARSLALQSGEVDIVGGTLSEISDFEAETLSKKYRRYDFEGTMSHFLAFNPDNQVLTKELRQAIGLGINKDNLSSKKMIGLFQPTVQYVRPENQIATEYNKTKAMELIETQGYQLNKRGMYEKDGIELRFDFIIQTAEFPSWKEKAEIIEASLKEIGIEANISILDTESYYDTLWQSKKFDLILYRTYTDALLPYSFMTSVFANGDETSGLLANDEKLTKMLTDFETLSDRKEQEVAFDTILTYFSQASLAVPVDYRDETFVTSESIEKFAYSGLSDAPIDYAQLKVK